MATNDAGNQPIFSNAVAVRHHDGAEPNELPACPEGFVMQSPIIKNERYVIHDVIPRSWYVKAAEAAASIDPKDPKNVTVGGQKGVEQYPITYQDHETARQVLMEFINAGFDNPATLEKAIMKTITAFVYALQRRQLFHEKVSVGKAIANKIHDLESDLISAHQECINTAAYVYAEMVNKGHTPGEFFLYTTIPRTPTRIVKSTTSGRTSARVSGR